MAKESFTGLFDNMPSVDNSTNRKAPKKETSSTKKTSVSSELKKNAAPVVSKEIAYEQENETLSVSSSPKHSAALPFLKAQKNTEKKNQTFYIPVYLHERLKESAEMYNMTVSAVLTEILKSVYDEK